MPLPTEPIGSIPRPAELLAAMGARARGEISRKQLLAAEQAALRDTIALFDCTGSPVITDGEQTKPSFATYPLSGLGNLAERWRIPPRPPVPRPRRPYPSHPPGAPPQTPLLKRRRGWIPSPSGV